jgi:hypothetical protein
MKTRKVLFGLALCMAVAGVAYATITFDGVTGVGFVGKGDVQYTFGWNNKGLQDNADSVKFQATSTDVTEVSWECTTTIMNTYRYVKGLRRQPSRVWSPV